MKKLQSLAFYTLITPAIALGSSAVFAQESVSSDDNRENQTTQKNYDDEASGSNLQDDQKMANQSGSQQGDYMESAPASGMQASNLIGSDVMTSGDEEVGEISDLIIDQDGKVAAVVVGVGGFLGMGEKDVAISWDKITQSGTADDKKLRINESRDALRDAPEYTKQD